jgi:hypothetical protein
VSDINIVELNPDGFVLHLPGDLPNYSGTFLRTQWEVFTDVSLTTYYGGTSGPVNSTSRYIRVGSYEGSYSGAALSPQHWLHDQDYYARVRLENTLNQQSDWSDVVHFNPGASPKIATFYPDLSQPLSGFDVWKSWGDYTNPTNPTIFSPVHEDGLLKLTTRPLTSIQGYETWAFSHRFDLRDSEVVFRLAAFDADIASYQGWFQARLVPVTTGGSAGRFELQYNYWYDEAWETTVGHDREELTISPLRWWKFSVENNGLTGKIWHSLDGDDWTLFRTKTFGPPTPGFAQQQFGGTSYELRFQWIVYDDSNSLINYAHIGDINPAAAPSELGIPVLHTVIPFSSTSMWLEWTPAENATKHQVHRVEGALDSFVWSSATLIQELGPTAASYEDTGLYPTTSYTYVIVAC